MDITQAFTEPANKAEVYKENNAINQDIRDYMEQLFPEAVAEAVNVDAIFKGSTCRETACLIWLFIRKRCTYRRDPDHNQIIRKPAYFVNHNPHQGDCKTFSMFSRSIYAAIYPSLPTAFKFVAYAPTAMQPTHVYTVVKDESGNEIIIDGCWGKFNSEKKYSFALPLKFSTMKVSSLGGVPPSTNQYNASALLNGINGNASGDTRSRIAVICDLRKELETAKCEYEGGHITKGEYTQRLNDCKEKMAVNGIAGINKPNAEKKAERKRKVGDFFKKFGHEAAFIMLAPVRGAFAALVAMNLNGLASNIRLMKDGPNSSKYTAAQKAIAADGYAKLHKIWNSLGGISKALDKAVAVGTTHKPLWFSKRAKSKFEGRAEAEGDVPGSQKWLHGIAGENGVWYFVEEESIGILPAIPAAVAAAGSAMAAMLPVIMKTLGGMGHKNEANSMAATGQDLMSQGQPTPAQLAQMAIPPGYNPGPDVDPNTMITDNDKSSDDGNLLDNLFDGLFGIAESLADALDQLTNLIPPPPPPAPGQFDWSQVTGPLTQFANVGLHLAAGAVEKKVTQNPKLQNIFGSQNLDQVFAGLHQRQNGFDPSMYHKKRSKIGPVLLIGGALYVVAKMSKGK